MLLRAARQARRARADPPGRPGAARAARGRARRRRADRRRVRRRAAAALRSRAARARAGVHLLTYHRAKGLEFDAVFLPRLEEKELPSKLARTDEEIAEERRLFYVGITRARRLLALTWSKRPSPFLAELGLDRRPAPASRAPGAARGGRSRPIPRSTRRSPTWRKPRAKAEEVPGLHRLPQQRPRRDRRRAAALARRARRGRRASARRSSSATATRCSRSSRG